MFSHSQTVVVCPSCNTVLCVPTGGKARLTEGAFNTQGGQAQACASRGLVAAGNNKSCVGHCWGSSQAVDMF